MTKMIRLAAVAASLLLSVLATHASAYSNVYVFGDSLSDNGNLQALDPSVPDRFTNGPVAAEVVAGALGFAVTPSYHLIPGATPGNNYAIAGAKAVDEDGDESTPDINLPTQVNAFLQLNGFSVPSDALYIVLIGGNDIRAAREIRSGVVFAETGEERRAIRQAARESINTAVESQIAQIEKLINAGAQHILVVNAPDIGAIPETDLVAMQLAAAAQTNKQLRKAQKLPHVTTKLSAKYNRKLAKKLARLEHRTGIDIIEYDLFGFLTEQIAGAEDYGYTNTDDACIYIFSQGGVVNPECADFPIASGFLFWDEIHPTTTAHQNAGVAIVETILSH
ncbi:MAG: SGNH/GDSL hydrolase family protein [Oleiphilaceae bacterium]|nr:SGNH/GDSL hydrolase family protein [Oleiphilaceae bacterium]